MLERIHIQGFKSLRDVEVELAPLTVLFGPNAAGKSNFLEALMLLSRLVRTFDAVDAFDAIRGYPLEAFALSSGGMDALVASPSAALHLDSWTTASEQQRLHYRIEVEIEPSSGKLSVVDEYLARKTPAGELVDEPAISSKGRRRPRKVQVTEELVGLSSSTRSVVASHAVVGADAVALRTDLATWHFVHLDPRDMRRAQPPRDTDGIGERGELLVPFLHRLALKHPKAFEAVVRGVSAIIPAVEAITTELVPSRGEIDLKVKQDGTWYSARVLSEGTLRVLALCALAAHPTATGLLGFEEPENGVHPRRIEVITSLLAHAAKRRQVIVTTHSPLVVGQIVQMIRQGELDADKVRFLRCSAGPEGTRLRAFDPLPVLDDAEIRAALADPDDADLIQAMLVRGWLE